MTTLNEKTTEIATEKWDFLAEKGVFACYLWSGS